VRIAQCGIGVMASTWPKATAWPNDLREHATYFSKYLRDALLCIESTKEQPIPAPLVKTMIAAMSVIFTKIESTPDYNTVVQALTTIQNDLNTTATTVKTTAETVQTTATAVQRTATASQQALTISQETKAITREVAEAGRAAAVIL